MWNVFQNHTTRLNCRVQVHYNSLLILESFRFILQPQRQWHKRFEFHVLL